MKSLKNDNRLIVPLALIALVFCGIAVVRVTGGGAAKVKKGASSSASAEASSGSVNFDIETPKVQRTVRDPFWHSALLKQDQEGNPLAQEINGETPDFSDPAVQSGFLPPLNGSAPSPTPETGSTPAVKGQTPPSAPGSKKPEANTPPAFSPAYRLSAILQGEQPLAVIQNEQNESFYVRQGELLPGSAAYPEIKVLKIDDSGVTLLYGKHAKKLTLNEPISPVKEEAKP